MIMQRVKRQLKTQQKKIYDLQQGLLDYFNPYRIKIEPERHKYKSFKLNISPYPTFTNFFINRHQDSMIGFDDNKSYVIKIALRQNSKKINSIADEFAIMQDLIQKNCVTVPQRVKLGNLSPEHLDHLRSKDINIQGNGDYTIQEYLPSKPFVLIGDILLAIIEQKNLGFFHGDIKPNNTRILHNFCGFIDYDQAIRLPESIKNKTNDEFFIWANSWVKEKYNKPHVLSDFGIKDFNKTWNAHSKNGALNLALTSLYKKSNSTLTRKRIYHSLQEKDIFADGVRDLSTRIKILDKIKFQPGETVLDIGCNAGLLVFYLHDRKTKADGADIDVDTINAARIVANIIDKKASFSILDLDTSTLGKSYDTICLFSVLHHTVNVEENAKKIASSCERIIIECRLNENGAKPVNATQWIRTSSWSFDTITKLENYLETIFPGFKVKANHGQCDKGRFIIELLRKG